MNTMFKISIFRALLVLFLVFLSSCSFFIKQPEVIGFKINPISLIKSVRLCNGSQIKISNVSGALGKSSESLINDIDFTPMWIKIVEGDQIKITNPSKNNDNDVYLAVLGELSVLTQKLSLYINSQKPWKLGNSSFVDGSGVFLISYKFCNNEWEYYAFYPDEDAKKFLQGLREIVIGRWATSNW